MAFQQGLSGLNASSKALDVISNNVANSSTVGFKTGDAHFADMYASALSGAGASQIGIGTSISAIMQQYTQGNISTTNNPLDIAINGNGFYRLSTNGSITYTRNGQFHEDKNGYIVNDQGARLTGYKADATGLIVPSTPTDLQVNTSDIAPVETGTSVGGDYTGVKAVLNMDSRQTSPTGYVNAGNAWTAGPTTGTWNPNANTYNYSTSLDVYDSLGNSHNLTMYFVKNTTSGQWEVHANVDGTTDQHVTFTNSAGTAVNPPVLQFDSNGALDTATSVFNVKVDLNGVETDLGATNGANSPIGGATGFKIDFSGTTQYGSSFSNTTLKQDGYTSGRLTGLSVSTDGTLQGRYSNGQTKNMGQIVLANFPNNNGLTSLGGNQWAETSTSGQPTLGTPNTGSLGSLQSNAVEESNVDLTAELVDMITQQRNYQANSQSIKTQDQIMNTLVNLR